MTHFGQQFTLAVFVPPCPTSLVSFFFFFSLRSLGLRFSGSFLLVGHCLIFCLQIAYSLLPVPNYTFTDWMNGNKE